MNDKKEPQNKIEALERKKMEEWELRQLKKESLRVNIRLIIGILTIIGLIILIKLTS